MTVKLRYKKPDEDTTAVTASDKWFPDIARSCEKSDKTVGEPPYERDDKGDSLGHSEWVDTSKPKPADTGSWRDGHGPSDIGKFGASRIVGEVLSKLSVKIAKLLPAARLAIGVLYVGKLICFDGVSMWLEDPWGTKYDSGYNVWVPGHVQLSDRARTYFDSGASPTYDMPPAFQNKN